MRYLALDVGNKRVGVAVGSSEGRIATPLAVIQRVTIELEVAQLKRMAEEYEVEHLVVGLPRNTDDSESDQEKLTRRYIAQIEPALGLPVTFFDERYSTAVAMERQRTRGLNEKRGRTTLDADAAAVILQEFLDSLGTGN